MDTSDNTNDFTWQWYSTLNGRKNVIVDKNTNRHLFNVSIETTLDKIVDAPIEIRQKICDAVDPFVNFDKPVSVSIRQHVVQSTWSKWIWMIYAFNDEEINIQRAIVDGEYDLYDIGHFDQIN